MMARRHIHDERGASILIALFFLLVCAVIAAITLTSASVNAERTKRHAQEEQAYYALSSAVDSSVAIVLEDQGPNGKLEPLRSVTFVRPQTGDTGTPIENPTEFVTWAVAQADRVWHREVGDSTDKPQPLTLNVKASNPYAKDGGTLGDMTVQLTFTMDQSYNIKVVGELVSSDGVAYEYTLARTIEARVQRETGEGGSDTTRVTWGVPA